jgi:uncharacterized membrane protein YtjA (UPF0391 family)
MHFPGKKSPEMTQNKNGTLTAMLRSWQLADLSYINIKFLEDINMFSWALTFLVIGLIAAVFGFTGIAGTATNIAWILFVVGIILAIVFAVAGRRGPRI